VVSVIRVLLVDTPGTLSGGLIAALDDQPDITLLDRSTGIVELLLQAGDADVVILEMTGGIVPAAADLIIDEYPRVGVVCVDSATKCGVFYWGRPPPDRIEAATPGDLIAAVRQAAGELRA